MALKYRDVLLALSYRFEGDWEKIFSWIRQKPEQPSIEEVQNAYMALKSFFVDPLDESYPKTFKSCFKMPLLLYYYGNLDLLNREYRLTCIGTRSPTAYQQQYSRMLIKEAERHFKNELVIISGMASGLDQICMKAAMEEEAPIVAIIGSGIDNPYPNKNQGIYEYCKKGFGLVISEYPGETQAQPEYFLFRNRLLASAAPVLYVGGAKNHSGTSSTVHYALDLGKEICALPCDNTGDDLTNTLIQNGATSVVKAQDLIEAIENASIRL